jgi:hypothetical protein
MSRKKEARECACDKSYGSRSLRRQAAKTSTSVSIHLNTRQLHPYHQRHHTDWTVRQFALVDDGTYRYPLWRPSWEARQVLQRRTASRAMPNVAGAYVGILLTATNLLPRLHFGAFARCCDCPVTMLRMRHRSLYFLVDSSWSTKKFEKVGKPNRR